MMGRVEADFGLAKRFAILTSIPGVSRLIAFALLIERPRLGTLEAAQAASLTGLAPVARQTGRWTGRAFIRGGRASVRKALYMPALVCRAVQSRHESQIRAARRQRKGCKGRTHSIMRKLLVLANALLKNGRTWTTNLA